MQKSPNVAVVVDVGGTTTCAARFTDQHLDKRVQCPTPTVLLSPDVSVHVLQQQLVDVVVEAISAVMGDMPFGYDGTRTEVAMTFSGRVDIAGRSILSAPDIWGTWATVFPLAGAIEQRLGGNVELRIASDVVAAASRYKTHLQTERSFALLMVRTSLSYAVRKPETTNMADPVLLGHMPVSPTEDTFQCSCGGQDHYSAHASGAGVANVIMCSALRNPKAFRSSELFHLAAKRYEQMRFEHRQAALRRHAVLLNVRQHIDEDVWRNMQDRHAELTPGELQRWMFPSLLDAGMFIEAVAANDPYALSLLDVIARPVAEHLRNYVFDHVDIVALGGGFARALGEPYRVRIAPPDGRALVQWAEGEDLGDLRGAKDHLWPQRGDEVTIDLRDSARTTTNGAPA